MIDTKRILVAAGIISFIIILPCVLVYFYKVPAKDEPSEFPQYGKIEIEQIFSNTLSEGHQELIDGVLTQKAWLSEDAFRILLEQTGLGKAAIIELFRGAASEEELIQELKEYQSSFFGETQNAKLVPLKEGDILISDAQKFVFYCHGHAAIVTDVEKEKTLEAKNLGEFSKKGSFRYWRRQNRFVVLRIKDNIRFLYEKNNISCGEKAAAYAMENLNNTDYSLIPQLSFLGGVKERTSQCAYLVWDAYYETFHINLDSNRGIIIAPADLMKSPYLELVQIYGIPID